MNKSVLLPLLDAVICAPFYLLFWLFVLTLLFPLFLHHTIDPSPRCRLKTLVVGKAGGFWPVSRPPAIYEIGSRMRGRHRRCSQPCLRLPTIGNFERSDAANEHKWSADFLFVPPGFHFIKNFLTLSAKLSTSDRIELSRKTRAALSSMASIPDESRATATWIASSAVKPLSTNPVRSS